jgi:hypothetical protein
MSWRAILQCLRMPSVLWSLVALVAVCVIPVLVLVVFQVFSYFEHEESKLAAVEIDRARTINYAIDRDIDHLQAILRVFAANLAEDPAASSLLHAKSNGCWWWVRPLMC